MPDGRDVPAATDAARAAIGLLDQQRDYRGRFAPSPTGPLHFGSLIAALASYCDARQAGGSWQLRIDDIDPPRSVPGAADGFICSLARFGFRWDGEVCRQSERSDRYQRALRALESRGLLYCCQCSRRTLRGHSVYPGFCRPPPHGAGVRNGTERRAIRDLIAAWGPANSSLRLKVGAPVCFDDAVFGMQPRARGELPGDIVVKRRDGWFAYHLACAIDDAYDVTCVVRGADLLDSTVAQLAILRALNLPEPRYMHVPVAIDHRGRKLSKHAAAAAIDNMAVLPTLLQAWAFLGQIAMQPTSLDQFWREAVPRWCSRRIPRCRQLLKLPGNAAVTP